MQDQLAISRNEGHLAVIDDPGRIFVIFFDGPGFFNIVSGVDSEETSVDVPGAEPKFNGGKMKGP